jgi:hypothetical protein
VTCGTCGRRNFVIHTSTGVRSRVLSGLIGMYDGLLKALLELDLTREQFIELAPALDITELLDLYGNPINVGGGDTTLAARLRAIYVRPRSRRHCRRVRAPCLPKGHFE